MRVEPSHQLGLLGSKSVDLSLLSNQILFPPIDLIDLSTPFEHVFIMKKGWDKKGFRPDE